MKIHTVQPNDTIYTIADDYNIPLTRLLKDNNLPQNYTLTVVQSLIVTDPKITYIVQEGDTHYAPQTWLIINTQYEIENVI
jgi:spore germination protein